MEALEIGRTACNYARMGLFPYLWTIYGGNGSPVGLPGSDTILSSAGVENPGRGHRRWRISAVPGAPYGNTSAAAGYPPNVALCRETLLPLGIDFRAGDGAAVLPFPDYSFDLILNRHGDVNAVDVARLLKPGGFFLTEQVGAENDRELVELLLGKLPLPYPDQTLERMACALTDAGLTICRGETCFRPILFYDVGALVWFARILPWEFPGFSVDACQAALFQAQEILEETGSIAGRIHRFLIVARK